MLYILIGFKYFLHSASQCSEWIVQVVSTTGKEMRSATGMLGLPQRLAREEFPTDTGALRTLCPAKVEFQSAFELNEGALA